MALGARARRRLRNGRLIQRYFDAAAAHALGIIARRDFRDLQRERAQPTN